jgi:hypothetical protein
MNEKLRQLSDSELIDELSLQTSKLTRLFSSRTMDDEYDHCKERIQALTAEFERRKGLETSAPLEKDRVNDKT